RRTAARRCVESVAPPVSCPSDGVGGTLSWPADPPRALAVRRRRRDAGARAHRQPARTLAGRDSGHSQSSNCGCARCGTVVPLKEPNDPAAGSEGQFARRGPLLDAASDPFSKIRLIRRRYRIEALMEYVVVVHLAHLFLVRNDHPVTR